METIDPKDLTNQQATNELLEKSRLLKEKAKATNQKLEQLKEETDKLIHDKPEGKN